MSAPFGRRACEVAGNTASGGYRIFSLRDGEGPLPEPGQFYMLASERGWGEGGGRPFLPRAISVAEAVPGKDGVRLDFLVEGVGPGTDRLCELEAGERVWVTGPLGNSFSTPKQVNPDAAGAILVGGGIGIAPLAIWRRHLVERGIPLRVLLGFRNEAHSGGLNELFCAGDSLCPDVRLASEDGHAGHRGYVTDLLATMLAGDDATSAVVYSCGPPAMLEAVALLCQEHGVSYQLAEESPMACGFGACFGCAVPKPGGGYLRLCVDGPVTGSLPVGGAVGGTPPEEALATGRGGGSPVAAGPAGQDAPVPADLSLEEIQRVWPTVLHKLQETAPALAATLEGARPVSFGEEGLQVAFPTEMTFLKKKAEGADRRDTVAAAFAAVTGVGLRPTYVLLDGEAPPDTPAPGSEEIDEDELLEQLKSEFDAEEVS